MANVVLVQEWVTVAVEIQFPEEFHTPALIKHT